MNEQPARPAGRPLAIDAQAHVGEASGFRLGMITGFLAEPAVAGDAYVVAPDGSRAGLVWESGCAPYFAEVMAPEPGRWGVWAAGLPLPLTTVENARRYLAALLPQLRQRWESWREASERPNP